MLRVSAKVSGPLVDGRFKVSPLSKKQFEKLKAQWRKAISVGVARAADVMPVDTGMSLASLRPLQGELRIVANVTTPLSRKLSLNKNKKYYDFDKYVDRPKSVAYGEELGRNAYTINYGSPTSPNFTFTFKIPVYQWARWEEQWRILDHIKLEIEKAALMNLKGAGFKAYLRTYKTDGR